MYVSNFTFAVELSCNHVLCFKCAVKKLPLDQTEVHCDLCECPQKLKSDRDFTLINEYKQE